VAVEKIEGRSVFSDRGVVLSIEKGIITEVDYADLPPEAPCLSTGFTDIQVNGYMGIDYSAPWFGEGEVSQMVNLLAKSGITRHCPTIVTCPSDRIIRNIKTIVKAINNSLEFESSIPGIHVEGPYISSEDGPRGAHDSRYVRDPDFDEYLNWQEAASGLIKIITLAPERKGALDFIQRVSKNGVAVAIGHTGAEPELIKEAVSAGARLSTHLGNGSHSRIPRLKNYIWEQLADDNLYASIIVDGYHLPESVVKVFARAKGLEKIILVSDVSMPAGRSPGLYKWGNIDVQVFKDGHLGLAGTEFLAGAGHLLDRDIAQFIRFTGHALKDAVKLCTSNPAKILGIDLRLEEFSPGMPADIVQFRCHQGAEKIEVLKTIFNGTTLYAGKTE